MGIRRAEIYQYALILLGIVSALLFGIFWYRELFPEYRIYQNDYIALEKFRSTYTGEPLPPFQTGVKQIVIEREDRGPPTIDRCISCHIALQFQHFSPTKIARDINGNMIRDPQGIPVKEPNENYIWAKLDEKIAFLKNQGLTNQAQALEALKTAEVDNRVYDVTKALSMHPLMGKETRPFEFHPVEEYGCVSCHSGNGRALTAEKAHGPVFDEQYEISEEGPKQHFLELDPANDPSFSRVFNDKPGHDLLFQTTPILPGSLIEAKCIQCHQPSLKAIQHSVQTTQGLKERQSARYAVIAEAYENAKNAVATELKLLQQLQELGFHKTLEEAKKQAQNYTLPQNAFDQAASTLRILKQEASQPEGEQHLRHQLERSLNESLGNPNLVTQLQQQPASVASVEQFVTEHLGQPEATGTLFVKAAAWNVERELLRHVEETTSSIESAAADEAFTSAIRSDVDTLTQNYQHGEDLYISQACYACHRIGGLARGGIGPELTRAGLSYPWFIKESLTWPQRDLKNSTMPNFKLDHEELEDLVTFLLGQTGSSKAISSSAYKIALQEWEAGKKSPWEKAITPSQIYDLRYSMTVFAVEGCAACHRLKGYESNIGFASADTPEKLEEEKQWFSELFPEQIIGSQIVKTIEQHVDEIDRRIVNGKREGSLLEEIQQKYPGHIEALNSNFRYAARAKNHFYEEQLSQAKDPTKRFQIEQDKNHWQERINRIHMTYIQEYGLGRLICPRPNWSGIFRSDEWLMEHFHNPAAHVPRSLMPVFPFDDSKFYALTNMLNQLGILNRDADRRIWQSQRFDPAQAYQMYCAQCHGDYLGGNGPVAEWIYPVPKNLRNAVFLSGLTREQAIQSILHGVNGTPMPPWGEIGLDKLSERSSEPVLKPEEISTLVDWLFTGLPQRNLSSIPKWKYQAKDVTEELKREGKSFSSPLFDEVSNSLPESSKLYFINKQFYTPQNIEEGKAFFETNCAICHGKEGDGTGIRAGLMDEAKPRMFTNLDWITSHDDLRLLRSIKYGVPGTAMTPWGDLTASWQRVQLVIFIRTLTEARQKRESLLTNLYQAFQVPLILIESWRAEEFTQLDNLKKELKSIQNERKKVSQQSNTHQQAVALYQKELDLMQQVKQLEMRDQLFIDLKNELKQEQTLYQNIGLSLLTRNVDDHLWKQYLELIELLQNRYQISENGLILFSDSTLEEKIQQKNVEIEEDLNTEVKKIEAQQKLLEGKFLSTQRAEESAAITIKLNSLVKLRQQMVTNFEQAARHRKQEAALFAELKK